MPVPKAKAAGLRLDEEWRTTGPRAAPASFNEVVGTTADDLIVLRKVSAGVSGAVTWSADKITARTGADRIDASRGDDLVFGEVESGASALSAGDDRIKGGPGNDRLYGEGVSGAGYTRFGADRIDGGVGTDEIVGDAEDLTTGVLPGADRLYGNAGNDVLRGDGKLLANIGSSGQDRLYGGPGDDLMVGDADRLRSGAQGANDLLDGGPGDDVLVGDGLLERGADGLWDTLSGGPGDDRLYGDAPIGADAVTLGAPADSYPWAFGQDGGKDTLDGGAGDDLLVGGTGPDDLIGGEGADTFLFFPTDEDFRDGTEDRILDFESGEDKVDLTWWDLDGEALDDNADGILDAEDELFSQDGDDLVLDLGASTVETVARFGIFVRFVGVSELSVDDLVPVPPSSA
ncbi:MAG: hypothetical protein KatS3mg117_1978 [Geminicoccaceae bacterium]|nr:MAG: hypothetical protein KatS3mg117_1978 [Geminicoccaceae bacterium]